MNVKKSDMLQQSQNTNKQNSILNQSKSEKQQKKGSIYAGNLNMMNQQDDIAMKHVQAQKKAMKSILDQFTKDGAIDDNLAARRIHQSELANEAKAAQEEVGKIQDLRQQLKDSNEIDDNSEEQKNLELLEKSMDASQTLSDDEMEQLKNMGPLTEYQKSALKYNSMEEVWQQRADDALQGITNEGKTIVAIKLELLKIHPMTDAQKEAAEIMDAANKEVIGSIIQESKDHIDEEIEKNEEEAEKQAEKQEDSESKTEDSKQNSEINDSDQLQQAVTTQDKMLRDLKTLIEKEKILDEDVKGITLDEQI